MAFQPRGGWQPSNSAPSFQPPQFQRPPLQAESSHASYGPATGARQFASDFASDGPPLGSFPPQGDKFDVIEWYPQFQSCVRYFLDHAQYDPGIQALAAFVNIELPFQRSQCPVPSSRLAGAGTPPQQSQPMPSMSARASGKLPMPNLSRASSSAGQQTRPFALLPYIRRLVVTGFDHAKILHGFFGDDWPEGVGPLHELERRNYLFAAKSRSWLDVKSYYDMGDEQLVPFLRPPTEVKEKEIVNAEKTWSEWLAMQDWMLGPRSPDLNDHHPGAGTNGGHNSMG